MKNAQLLFVLACFFGLSAILATLFLRSSQEGAKESKRTTVQIEYYFPQYPTNGTFWECQVEMGFIN